MNIKTTTRFGGNVGGKKDDPTVRNGFALTFETGELSDDVLRKLAMAGLEKVCNYGAASRVCKALGVEKNSLAEYSAERAATVKATIEAFARNATENGVGIIPLTVTVTEHVPGATSGVSEIKRNALDRLAAWESSEDGLEAALARRGYSGATHGDDGEYHPDAIAHVIGLLRAAMAAL